MPRCKAAKPGTRSVEARARAVRDDKLLHLAYELAILLEPADVEQKADLAYLDRG